MSALSGATYPRTAMVLSVIVLGTVFAFSGARLDLYDQLLPVFEWLETTPFGVIGKTWGAAFAVVEAVHLLAMALLGGAVLVADGRLLGLVFADRPMGEVMLQSDRAFNVAIVVVILTGVFMACGVALKIYYLNVFWYKMLALFVGLFFVFFLRRPLLRKAGEQLPPALRRMLAVASLMIWFSVAATGRWIGFSG